MTAAPSLLDYAPKILDRREVEGIRGIKSERNRYEIHLATAAFATIPLTEIRPRHVRLWAADMQQKPAADTRGARKLSTDTVKRAAALLAAIFGEAVNEDILEQSPSAGLKIKRRIDELGKADPWTFLSLAEQIAIAACEAIPIADRLAIAFAIGTGLRQGEWSNLAWSDIHDDVADPFLLVRWGSKGKPPKNGKQRTVPLLPHVIETIRAWRALQPSWSEVNPDGLAFPNRRGLIRSVGKPLGGGGKLKRYLALVGITRRVRWHDLRHTFGSALISGMWGHAWPLEEIRPIIGHSSITMTQRYAHVCQTRLADAARKTNYGGFIAPVIPPAPDTARELYVPPANDTCPDLGAIWFDEEEVA